MRILLVFDRTQFSENGRFETRTNQKSAVQSHSTHISALPIRTRTTRNVPLSVAELGKWVKVFGGGIVTSALQVLSTATPAASSDARHRDARHRRPPPTPAPATPASDVRRRHGPARKQWAMLRVGLLGPVKKTRHVTAVFTRPPRNTALLPPPCGVLVEREAGDGTEHHTARSCVKASSRPPYTNHTTGGAHSVSTTTRSVVHARWAFREGIKWWFVFFF